MLNNFLHKISYFLLKRNMRFKNIHKGESCYIFGDGVSLKDMNLKYFGDKIAFGSNMLLCHSDFEKLNIKYYVMPAPYWFFYFWKNPYTKRIVFNNICRFQRLFMSKNKHVNFFINLSNAPVLFKKNIFYLHHFGEKKLDKKTFDLNSKFNANGALNSMIGIAIYMGFSEAYLVGCDYTHSPQRILHFYEKGRGKVCSDNEYNKEFFDFAGSQIKLYTITNEKSSSKVLDYYKYNDFTGDRESYRENTEIVKPAYLKAINTFDGYEIF